MVDVPDAPYLPKFQKRQPILIPAGAVSDNLPHFPILVKLGASSGVNGFDTRHIIREVGANKLRIAVTKEDGVTQLYVEIEQWDTVNEVACLWVSRSDWTISSVANNFVFLYWESDVDNINYVGVQGSAPAQAVWDSSFKGVWHMNDATTSTILDSTSNGNDGTKKAANEPLEVVGQIGKAQQGDGVDDIITLTEAAQHLGANNFSVEGWVRYENTIPTGWSFEGSGFVGTTDLDPSFQVGIDGGNLFFYTRDATGISRAPSSNSGHPFTIDVWSHVFAIRDGTHLTLFIDGTLWVENTDTIRNVTNAEALLLFKAYENIMEGSVDEVRLCDVARSSAWVGASYQTQNDTLLVFLPYSVSEATMQSPRRGPLVPKPPIPRTLLVNVRDLLRSRVGD